MRDDVGRKERLWSFYHAVCLLALSMIAAEARTQSPYKQLSQALGASVASLGDQMQVKAGMSVTIMMMHTGQVDFNKPYDTTGEGKSSDGSTTPDTPALPVVGYEEWKPGWGENQMMSFSRSFDPGDSCFAFRTNELMEAYKISAPAACKALTDLSLATILHEVNHALVDDDKISGNESYWEAEAWERTGEYWADRLMNDPQYSAGPPPGELHSFGVEQVEEALKVWQSYS